VIMRSSFPVQALPFFWSQVAVLCMYCLCLKCFSWHIDSLFERELRTNRALVTGNRSSACLVS